MKTLYHAWWLQAAVLTLVAFSHPSDSDAQVHPFSSTGYMEEAELGHWLEARPVAIHDNGTCTFPDASSLSAQQPCEGDVTGDGFVNVSDILLTLSRFNTLCE